MTYGWQIENVGKLTGRAPLPTGRIKSGPTSNVAAHLLKKIKRFRTDTAPDVARAVGHVKNEKTPKEGVTYWHPITVVLPDAHYTEEHDFVRDVKSVIASRLEARGVSPELFKSTSPSWCLPKGLHEQDEWRLLLESPVAVPTVMLEKMFHLERVTPNDKKMTKAEEMEHKKTVQAVYYLREFTMTAREARQIFKEMLLDGYDTNRNVYVWWEIADQMQNSDTLTLRYIGQTDRDPWARHRSDIYSTSLRSFLGRFCATASAHCPHVLSEAKIFEFREARAFKGVSSQLQDLFEQVLIAVFGDGVLNTDVGGENGFITLSDNDKAVFDLLNINTTAKLTKLAPCTNATRQKLATYARKVAKYVDDTPTTREGYRSKHAFSALTQQMLVDQGAFRELPDGSAAIAFLGSDLGGDHEEDEKPFFEAGGRTADVVSALLNHFGQWDSLPAPFDEKFTKRLAQENNLPFFDYFPWFVKHQNDYAAANKYSLQYLNIANPYIHVPFGVMPTYAATNSFKMFSSNDFTNYESSIANRRSGSADYWLNKVLGQPHIAYIKKNESDDDGTPIVVIPCYHPGMLGYAGHMKELSQRVIGLVLSLAWAAIHQLITLHENEPTPYASHYRLNICERLVNYLKGKLSTSHPFGQAFARAKAEWAAASKVESDQRQSRIALSAVLDKPAKGLLEQKVGRERQDKRDTSGSTAAGMAGPFEVDIREIKFPGFNKQPSGVRILYQLRWTEPAGKQLLEPIAFPDNVLPQDLATEKRFVWYTATGLDIRDASGASVGDRARMPNARGNGKNETLPIAALVLMLQSHVDSRKQFLDHWEHTTGQSVNEVLGAVIGLKSSGGRLTSDRYIPDIYFDQWEAPGLPVIPTSSSALRQSWLEPFVKQVAKRGAAKPSDVRWILDKFIEEEYPGDGESQVNLCPGSLLRNESVYEKIKHFCAKAEYKHHPHWNTLLSLAVMTEMGMYERHMPTNYLSLALQVLRHPYKAGNKRKKGKVKDESFEIGHQVLTIGNTRPAGVIAAITGDLPWTQDITVEEGDAVEELSDDAEAETTKKVDKKGKGKIKASGAGSGKRKRSPADTEMVEKAALEEHVEADDDDEMLFDTASIFRKQADEDDNEMLLDPSRVPKRKIAEPRSRLSRDTGTANIGSSAGLAPVAADTSASRKPAKTKAAGVAGALPKSKISSSKAAASFQARSARSIFDAPDDDDDDSSPELPAKKRRKENKGGASSEPAKSFSIFDIPEDEEDSPPEPELKKSRKGPKGKGSKGKGSKGEEPKGKESKGKEFKGGKKAKK